jgi:shikimate kinase
LKTCKHFLRIFLIGFSGSGKTLIGKKLAAALGYTFIDTDLLFEAVYGCTIADFFEQHGETVFRKKEYELLKSILVTEDVVIATGGGTPCFADSLSLMLNSGHVIYLKATPKMLYERLANSRGIRPLISEKSGVELLEYIYDVLREREPMYNQAHSTVEALGLKSPKEIERLSQWLIEKGKWQTI